METFLDGVCQVCGHTRSEHEFTGSDGKGRSLYHCIHGCGADYCSTRKLEEREHHVIVRPDYDDNGALRSWDTERCTCDKPWRHRHGTA